MDKNFSSGEKLPASVLNQIMAEIRKNAPRGDGKTIRVNQSPGGSTISAIKQSSSSAGSNNTGVKLCRINSHIAGNIYAVSFYDETSGNITSSGYAMPLKLHISEIIPNGTKVLVKKSTVDGLTLSRC